MSNENKSDKKLECPSSKKIMQLLLKIISDKFGDDYLQMMGASEVLQELLKNKVIYQMLT